MIFPYLKNGPLKTSIRDYYRLLSVPPAAAASEISGVGLEVLGLKVFRDFLGVGLDPVEVGHEYNIMLDIPIYPDIDILDVTRI